MDLELPNWDCHNSSVTEGRLLILWRRNFVKVNIIKESSQAVHCLVKMSSIQQSFGVTFVYGFNSIEGRRYLWDDLHRPFLLDKAWLILGDFNAPFSGKDRLGGKPISGLELEDSIRWLAGAHFEPLRSVGSYFTWSNNQEDHCSSLVRLQTPAIIGSKLFRDRVGDIGANYHKSKESYQEARMQAQAHPHDQCFQEDEKLAAEAFSVQERLYYSFLVQRSKITWLRQGDLNTSFFYASLKKRKAENSIVSFINEDGCLIDNFSEVVSHYAGHFRGVLGSASSASCILKVQHIEMGPRLSVDQQVLLLKPFSKKEIREVLFSIPITKSPGLDGYGSGFFKSTWHDIGDEVCTTILHCFETGRFPPELHETTLSLIPKVDSPSRAIDYRPIACCSTLYKCMAKLLCKRLEVVLPDLVQANQGAFVKGRTIAHNIMIFQDLIKNYGRSSTSSRCAIKIDLSKAYDMVDWDFLEDLLNALSFPKKFIGWVMTCVRSASYSLVLNGIIQGKFKRKKGLRQGNPMSPLLFVLIMEYLTRSFQFAALNCPFRYHPMCKSLKLINLCFADDLLVFCKGSLQAVRSVKAVLEDFASVSSLSINTGKSQIFFGGVPSIERSRIALDINLSEGSFPLKYLGVPMRPTKWKHADCEVIIQKYRLKIQNWMSRHLSFAAYGGLGFRDGAIWNCSVLAKYIWAISTNPDLLWVKWINSIYLKGVNIWNYELKGDCSWYWRKLCRIKAYFGPAAIISAGIQGKFRSGNLYNSQLVQQKVEYQRTVWSKQILPKHRFMLWQAINSHLLTRDNLTKMHIQIVSSLCPVCESSYESHSHLFFDCTLSSQLVSCIFKWLGFVAWPLEFKNWLVWLARARNGAKADIVNMIFAVVIYNLWKNRNRCIFDCYSSSVMSLVQDVKFTTKFRLYKVYRHQLSVQDQLFMNHILCN
ncbi:uncharacterized protein LOC133815075 [Humulus lupulus]|uniref:uncharacterized protein LOC133815075 n=1 Tax=Humulus lupulus TaxID=3486 RepID=UPI002B406965|nr:uncharacterized protein LOC133815075 [Humulus lupulus]